MAQFIYDFTLVRGSTLNQGFIYSIATGDVNVCQPFPPDPPPSTPVDLTGGTFDALMRFNPSSCPGRSRAPIVLQTVVTTPTTGQFALYLPPANTVVLALGVYQYRVLFSPPASSDKNLVVRGQITVIDA